LPRLFAKKVEATRFCRRQVLIASEQQALLIASATSFAYCVSNKLCLLRQQQALLIARAFLIDFFQGM